MSKWNILTEFQKPEDGNWCVIKRKLTSEYCMMNTDLYVYYEDGNRGIWAWKGIKESSNSCSTNIGDKYYIIFGE
jgi:hypothetical protein